MHKSVSSATLANVANYIIYKINTMNFWEEEFEREEERRLEELKEAGRTI